MTDASTTGGMPPPGWYDDPGGSGQERWWGGLAWTEHVRAQPVLASVVATPAAPTPAPAPVAVVARPLDFTPYMDTSRSTARAEALPDDSPHTVPVWILAIYPIVGLLLNAVVLFNLERPEVIIVTAIAVVLSLFLLAVWDRAVLRGRLLGAPSLWWFLLAFPLSYLIARWVGLARRGVPGAAPTVTYFVSSLIAGVLAAVFAGTVGLSALGPTLVHQLEQQLTTQLENETATSWLVDCPDNAQLWEPGATFECAVTGASSATLVGHVVAPFEYEFEQ